IRAPDAAKARAVAEFEAPFKIPRIKARIEARARQLSLGVPDLQVYCRVVDARLVPDLQSLLKSLPRSEGTAEWEVFLERSGGRPDPSRERNKVENKEGEDGEFEIAQLDFSDTHSPNPQHLFEDDAWRIVLDTQLKGGVARVIRQHQTAVGFAIVSPDG